MGRLVLGSPGVIAGAGYGASSPLDFIAALYAGYLLGTDYHVGAETETTPLADLSGYDRGLLIETGASGGGLGLGAKKFVGENAHYLTTPFTADTLADYGTDEQYELIAIGKFPTASLSRPFNNGQTGADERMALDATTAWDVSITQFDDVGSTTKTLGNPVDANRDTKYMIIGGAFGLNSVQPWKYINGVFTEGAVQPVASVGRTSIGGPAFRLVYRNDNGATFEQNAAFCCHRFLTTAERIEACDGALALFAAHGIVI